MLDKNKSKTKGKYIETSIGSMKIIYKALNLRK